MWSNLGLSWHQAVLVVISTVAIYLVFLVVLRLLGPRIMANLSGFDMAAAIAMGAVVGRSMLGYTPNLLAGTLALATLVLLQGGVGLARRSGTAERVVTPPAVLIFAGGHVLPEAMRCCHLSSAEINSALRLSGVHRYEQVAAMVLEPSGRISVLRVGDPIDTDLFADVSGAAQLR